MVKGSKPFGPIPFYVFIWSHVFITGMSYYDYNVEELEQLTPFDNFITGIRDEVTRQKYRGQLEMFLNPRLKESHVSLF